MLPAPAFCQRVKRPGAGAAREQHQESARNRQVLFEVQQLIAIAELGVEQDGGGHAECRKRERESVAVDPQEDPGALAQPRAAGATKMSWSHTDRAAMSVL